MNTRIAAIAGINVLLLVGGWFLLVAPQRHHAQTAATQLTQVQDELTRFGRSAAALGSPRHRPRIETADLYRLEQAMPANVDQADLLLAIDQLARASGVHVVSLALGTATAAVGYDVVPVQLGLQGDYSALTRLLERLRTLVSVRHGALSAHGRLFSVTSVSLTPATGKQETAAVSVEAFVYGSVAGVAPLSSATSTDTTGTDTTGTDTTSTTTTDTTTTTTTTGG